MEYHELALAAIGLAVAGIIKGVTGIGYATCAMPLLALAAGLQNAIALIVAPALASNLAVVLSTGMIKPAIRRFGLFYTAILPGIAIGAALLPLIDVEAATRGLAVLTLAYVLLSVARPQLSLSRSAERVLALPAGLANGVLTGLTGSQIVPLVPYMLALGLEPRMQVQAINLAVTIASMALGLALFASGFMTPELLGWSLAGIVPAVTATWIGDRLRGFLPVAALKRITLALLVVMAAALVARDIGDAATAAVCAGLARVAPAPTEPGTSAATSPRAGFAACLEGLTSAVVSTFAEPRQTASSPL